MKRLTGGMGEDSDEEEEEDEGQAEAVKAALQKMKEKAKADSDDSDDDVSSPLCSYCTKSSKITFLSFFFIELCSNCSTLICSAAGERER